MVSEPVLRAHQSRIITGFTVLRTSTLGQLAGVTRIFDQLRGIFRA
ncbi:hypothetical protein HMPREF1162_0264 [ [[Propionibacterium] namnetense SK182B-JCVI]|uniref:Uncharacterized protein n=1 Tax=[Propionibacterium] namnetense SK182B-JCVI TaxID=1051006 RepID=F9NT96_9ACTN|nr:hypothetical protein HMPREF1162_0264 [ [[Propionibacterium] namnetense SK182B-JCVI]